MCTNGADVERVRFKSKVVPSAMRVQSLAVAKICDTDIHGLHTSLVWNGLESKFLFFCSSVRETACTRVNVFLCTCMCDIKISWTQEEVPSVSRCATTQSHITMNACSARAERSALPLHRWYSVGTKCFRRQPRHETEQLVKILPPLDL